MARSPSVPIDKLSRSLLTKSTSRLMDHYPDDIIT
ncbi:hypothetical protein CCACVL1_00892 [Corchorus capsularis]|uniref:Uncharacterized protein n=1 Tax=Corchorus capsularis TaxID=210143 RepID=A0A1R3KTY1_COCAP|nr:hypothetical protein CCACVL1_00892 [Corchorus capsularis]